MQPFKKILLFCCFPLLLSVSSDKTFAQGSSQQFETHYNITYDILQTEETQVKQQITIINQQKGILATTYSLTVKQMNIYDIQAFDKRGKMNVDINTQANATTLKAKLNEQIVGVGGKNEITIIFKTKDLANKVGEVWNINIPQVSTSESTTEYNVNLNIPDELGPKIFLSPQPKSEAKKAFVTTYSFDKNTVNNKGITASFRKYQLLNFKLKYHLKNSSILPQFQEVAFPPQISEKQQINFKSIDPIPVLLKTDDDGNILAVYKVSPLSELNIELLGSAKLLGKQIQPEFGGKLSEIPKDLTNAYTKPDKYWESNSPQIKYLADRLQDKSKTVSQNAEAIYQYITKNLQYNFDVIKQNEVERHGALEVLTGKGPWACMEFTDLFIAAARAMGIPAKELDGYAFSNADNLKPLSIIFKSGDLLHAWPEYYDPHFGWVQIDPTWGTTSGIDYFTKLDTNHFVFSIKGINSQYPYPAGSYRLDNSEKQVEVDFAQNDSYKNFVEKVGLKKEFTFNIFQLLKGMRKYKITNESGLVISNINERGLTLLPYQSIDVYLPNNTSEIKFTDFYGADKTIKL